MDLSANLISLSLSDSGIAAQTFSSGSATASNNGGSTQSSTSSDPFEPVEAPVVNDSNTNNNTEGGGCGLLIDWGDEIQVPVPQAILTQAEVDDTFGVFSYAQKSSQLAAEKVSSLRSTSNDEYTASKLVRSFTSGRKSDPKVTPSKKQSDVIEPPSSEPENNLKGKIGDGLIQESRNNNDSVGSFTSDQPTVLEDDILQYLSAEDGLSEFQDGNAICDVKTDLSRNVSTGSDSELMDINNLSSFSFPDVDMDEKEFDIQKENVVDPSITSAIVNKIKWEILKDEEKSDEVYIPSGNGDHLTDVTCPTLNSTSATTRSNRLSSTSSISSVSTVCGSRLRSRLSSASTISDHSVVMGSPIRASYPFTKYMPTPNARTPIREHVPRDRLSESLSSPTRTRVFLQTGAGAAQISPSRVPIRKSISAETLYCQQSPSSRVGKLEVPKFSTPSASRTRSRYSIHMANEDNPPAPLERNVTFVSSSIGNVGPAGDHPSNVTHTITEAEKWMKPRLDRVSFSSTSSHGSSAMISPTRTFIKRDKDITLLSKQMKKVHIKQPGLTAPKAGKEGLAAVAASGVQPLRATAVVPPTSQGSVGATSNSKSNPFRIKPSTSSAITSTGQRKFVPPVAASSPKLGPSPSRPAANQITPSRSRYAVNARSSGYGQQNLNATFEAKEPLKSPNNVTNLPTAPKATVKPPAIPKSLKCGLPSLGTKMKPTTSAKAGDASTKTGSQPGFLRRPTATGGSSTSVNKENNARPVPRFGFPSRPRQ